VRISLKPTIRRRFSKTIVDSIMCIDYLQDRAKGSTLYGFRGGPAGIMKGKYVELNSDFIYPYRNQVRTENHCVLFDS
jgi:hypothetical protein